MSQKLKNVVLSACLVAGTILGGSLKADANDPCVKACNAATDRNAFGNMDYDFFAEDNRTNLTCEEKHEYILKRQEELVDGDLGRSSLSALKNYATGKKGCHWLCLQKAREVSLNLPNCE